MNILFIDSGNVARSRMARYFFNNLTTKHSASSTGTQATKWGSKKLGQFAQPIVDCMKEEGFDVSQDVPLQLTPTMVQKIDMIISFEKKEDLPSYVRPDKYWKAINPKGQSYEIHLQVRDKIKELVKELS